MQIIAITGAQGHIGSALRPLLRSPDRRLVLIDSVPVTDVQKNESAVQAEITDRGAMSQALAGADALVHLAAIPHEQRWADVAEVNITGTRVVLDASRENGVKRVLLASSVHAVGMASIADAAASGTLLPRPDTFYGVSKAADEALGALYATRYAMSVVSARICAFLPEPVDGLNGLIWFAPTDAARLVEATLALESPGSHIVWGVSADGADALGITDDQGIGFVPSERASSFGVSIDVDRSTLLGGVATDSEHPVGIPWS